MGIDRVVLGPLSTTGILLPFGKDSLSEVMTRTPLNGTFSWELIAIGSRTFLAVTVKDLLADSETMLETLEIAAWLSWRKLFEASILPVFVGHLAKDDDRTAWDSISSVFSVGLVLLVIGTVLFEFAAPGIIHLYLIVNHSQIASEQQRVATLLLRFFAPQLLFYGLIAILTAVLNARSVFAPPAYAPVVNNIVAIIVFLAFATIKKSLALGTIHALSPAVLLLGIGTTAGVALQFLFLIPYLEKARARLSFQPNFRNPAIREIRSISTWTLGFVIANQVALFSVLAIAAGSTPGTVSAYSYGYIFFQLPYGVAAYSIMAAMMPELAHVHSKGDVARYKKRLGTGLRSSVTIMIPAALVVTSFAEIK